GTGIVNPSFSEVNGQDFGTFEVIGNPDLKPEENQSFDIGIEIPVLAGRGFVDVTYFNETLTDEITSVPVVLGSSSTSINQSGDSTREGAELTGRVAATDNIDLRASYTFLDAKNPDGSVEIRRPEHELSLGGTLRAFADRATFTADLRHVAGNFDTEFFGGFETRELPDITTVDIAARYALNDNFTLTSRVTNLFDEDAMEVWGFAGRPRTAYIGFDARF
ncbi:MAG: TonB-dependent receptor, partial [Pseudomonadota bacterium]